jgi:hypothetical protein
MLEGRDAPEGMYLQTEWPRLNEGGVEALREWLSEHPGACYVAIDTLAKVRAPARGQNVYTEDYAALEQLLPLASEHGVAILVVHHLRKAAAADPMDEISGSSGLVGGVDGFLILRRDRGGKGASLVVDGRDIEEPAEYALHWNRNTATWTIEGDAEEVRISKQRADILLLMRRNAAPMSPAEVAQLLEKNRNSIKKLMWTMSNEGQLVKVDDRKFAIPLNDRGGYSGNPGNRQSNRPESQNTDTHQQNGKVVTMVTPVTVHAGNPAHDYEEMVGEDRIGGAYATCIHDVRGGCWLCQKSAGRGDMTT